MVYEIKVKEDAIMTHLPLVRQVVSRIDSKNSGYEFEDLVNIGIIGLMDALEKFDPSKNVPFEAYARVRINGAVIDELRRAGPVSRSRMTKLNEYYEAKNRLELELLRAPTDSELCDDMGVAREDLSSIYETLHYLSSTSLESIVFSEEGDGIELKNILEDKNVEKPEESFLNMEQNKLLEDCIDKLDEREKILLNLYYVEELSMREIGYILDISIPRVSQLHGKILSKLRESMSHYMEV